MFDILLRLIIAGVIGIIIGWFNINRIQGMRVFALICIGAALVTIVSTNLLSTANIYGVADPGRMSAQILFALGFLGLGLIWIGNDNRVHGISILANMWLVSIIGILIGMGLNSRNVAVIITIICILVFLNLRTVFRMRNEE